MNNRERCLLTSHLAIYTYGIQKYPPLLISGYLLKHFLLVSLLFTLIICRLDKAPLTISEDVCYEHIFVSFSFLYNS